MEMQARVQQYFLQLPQSKSIIAMLLRDIILSAQKDLTEAIKWNQLTFSMGKENIAFIYSFPQAGYINLGFFKATSLADPKNLFEGTGKGMRHIKIYDEKNIPVAQIKKWVREASSLVKTTSRTTKAVAKK
jgi:hypothetical protein